ncbi:hypothetical protein DPMN_189816 [Dreissena polymorpha]|uniref:Uncharacterized protein n=1 Tax=Dreissena polymorpha TaxID=45954 RepID=A0A9D4DV03_DREPO|nr:hypothetical protein DPMN_189816 [Dreissena polymorpha]
MLVFVFSEHVCDMNSDKGSIITKVADTLSIDTLTGPRKQDFQEIDTIEKLSLVWASKRFLRFKARQLHNINVDKPVGRLLKGVPDIRNVHQAALKKCAMKVCLVLQQLYNNKYDAHDRYFAVNFKCVF